MSHAIIMTSGDPIYYDANKKWIHGKQIDYTKNTKSILKLSLTTKKKSIINYKIAISKIENKKIKDLLYSILLDEKAHLKKLENVFNKYFSNN